MTRIILATLEHYHSTFSAVGWTPEGALRALQRGYEAHGRNVPHPEMLDPWKDRQDDVVLTNMAVGDCLHGGEIVATSRDQVRVARFFSRDQVRVTRFSAARPGPTSFSQPPFAPQNSGDQGTGNGVRELPGPRQEIARTPACCDRCGGDPEVVGDLQQDLTAAAGSVRPEARGRTAWLCPDCHPDVLICANCERVVDDDEEGTDDDDDGVLCLDCASMKNTHGHADNCTCHDCTGGRMDGDVRYRRNQ